MKILIIGAGATNAESINLGIEEESRLPLMSNFARKTWKEFNPHPYLEKYLGKLGYPIFNEDGREQFYTLESEGKANIEDFYEFCWIHKEHSWNWSNNQEVRKPGMVLDMKNVQGLSLGVLPKDFKKGIRMLSDTNTTFQVEMAEIDFWNNLLREGIGIPFHEIMINYFRPKTNHVKELTLTKK